ncbi:MAG: SufD family Fe-S cluster assembly protein [Ruminococcus sp.]|nr:SufD family Fe-S cluster assembly protein [Ruminococcus sp.]
MEKTMLNKLPVPTFRWLGVNGVENEIKEYETKNVSVSADKDIIRNDVTESSKFTIDAQNGETSEVVQYIKSSGEISLATEINVHNGAKVRLVQVFENETGAVSEVAAKVDENAVFELVQVYLGGKKTVSEIKTELAGRSAAFTADIGYRLTGEDKLDINLIAEHFGKKSTSEITVNGVLEDTAEKTFKGTIDFKTGAKAAKGGEKENVLLLDSRVKNRTVPLILCAEEDVEGSHGASIGKLDENHIFYMKSRGISEEKIYELAARSRLMQVISKIGDDQTKARISEALQWGEEDE